MTKILSIGNSFSQDATRYLQQIAAADGHPLFARNLMIGGCSLERHAGNVRSGSADYEYQEDASSGPACSIQDGLRAEDWDIVTVQQVSHLAGLYETYAPFLGEVLAEVRRLCPRAKIFFHSTWAYEWTSDHPGFANYGCDQEKMADAIAETTARISAEYDLPVIPTGLLIRKLRENAAFDIRKGGRSLCRDGFHLSEDYGRYAAGMLWYTVLTGRLPETAPVLFDGADPALLSLIRETVAGVCE